MSKQFRWIAKPRACTGSQCFRPVGSPGIDCPCRIDEPFRPEGLAIQEGKKLLTETHQRLPGMSATDLIAPVATLLVEPPHARRGWASGAFFPNIALAAEKSFR